MSFKNQLKTTLFIGSLTLLGCSSNSTIVKPNIEDSQVQSEESLEPYFKGLKKEKDRDFVLNNFEIGIGYLELNNIDKAHSHLILAVEKIESVYSNTKNASDARSVWHKEGRKDFKGEPYERSMAYYYLGLTYLFKGDYENARASFETGFIQDSFAEETQYRADFASLLYLSYWCSLQLDSHLLNQTKKELLTLRPDISLPKKSDTVLIIGESGLSPRKLSDGIGHHELVFRRGKSFDDQYMSYGKELLYPIEDIYWQSMTRGGREIDRIIKGKLHFRDKNIKGGSKLSKIASNAALFSSGKMEGVFSIISLGGAIQSIIGLSADASVDTRYITQLPDLLHVYSGKLDPNKDIEYLTSNKKAISDIKSNSIRVTNKDKTIIWHKSNQDN